jgi:hypothetical protein
MDEKSRDESASTDSGETPETDGPSGRAEISGLLVRRLGWAPLRVLAIVTGFSLVRGLLALVARYLLWLRRRATARVDGGRLELEIEWSIMGKRFRRSRTVAPLKELAAVRLENRKRYVQLLIGFGCLAVGTWVGVQWLVDGLRAGYPYLSLVGAGIVAAGILLDLVLYLVVPEGRGRSLVVLSLGPWRARVAGVDPVEGEQFLDAVGESWKAASGNR